MNQGGTLTNRPKEKNVDDDVQDVTTKKWQTGYMCQEKKEEVEMPALRIAWMNQ